MPIRVLQRTILFDNADPCSALLPIRLVR